MVPLNYYLINKTGRNPNYPKIMTVLEELVKQTLTSTHQN